MWEENEFREMALLREAMFFGQEIQQSRDGLAGREAGE